LPELPKLVIAKIEVHGNGSIGEKSLGNGDLERRLRKKELRDGGHKSEKSGTD
jgi:hypothetical protein